MLFKTRYAVSRKLLLTRITELSRKNLFISPITIGTAYVEKAVLKLATYELMFKEDIPVKVSINEAIELSKKYDDDKAYVFVNGVLNKVAESIGRK